MRAARFRAFSIVAARGRATAGATAHLGESSKTRAGTRLCAAKGGPDRPPPEST